MGRKAKVFLTVLLATVSVALSPATPAAAYPVSGWYVPGPTGPGGGSVGASHGQFTWYNRTTGLDGWVEYYNCTGGYPPIGDNIWVVFEAFAGATKVDTYWVQEADCTSPEFVSAIGDTNRVGGIDRIKVTVCLGEFNNWRVCGDSVNYPKP